MLSITSLRYNAFRREWERGNTKKNKQEGERSEQLWMMMANGRMDILTHHRRIKSLPLAWQLLLTNSGRTLAQLSVEFAMRNHLSWAQPQFCFLRALRLPKKKKKRSTIPSCPSHFCVQSQTPTRSLLVLAFNENSILLQPVHLADQTDIAHDDRSHTHNFAIKTLYSTPPFSILFRFQFARL